MALRRRDVVLAGFATFIAWNWAVNYFPALKWVAYALITGLLLPVVGLLYLLFTTSRGLQYDTKSRRRPNGPAFLAANSWEVEVNALRKRQEYKKEPLYEASYLISDALDELLDLILRDFVKSWYNGISKNPSFVNEVDRAIRLALGNIRDRILSVDLVEIGTSRLVPILTAHSKDFHDAETLVRGKNLNRSMTESEELDLAIAGKYRDGKLHQAASLTFSDTKLVQQEYLQHLVERLLPQILPENVIRSRAVGMLIKQLVSCAVLFPVMQILSDPDTWNQLMEGYGRTTLQDRSTVRKLRAALDEHTSPTPKSRRAMVFPRLLPNDNERKFEKFIRAIRKVNNLSDARRFRSEVSSQMKKDLRTEIQDPVYLRRLDMGKRILDQKVNQLAAGGEWRTSPVSNLARSAAVSKLEHASLVELLHDSSGLSYFMEYMDRQNMMSMVQFWIVVDGFRNPLEDDVAEEDDLHSAPPRWTQSDREDLAQIDEAYLSKPELNVPTHSKQTVREFLKAGKGATPQQYHRARKAILRAQTAALEVMSSKYFEGFKKSDLFFKCLTAEEAAKKPVLSPRSPLSPSSVQPRSATARPATSGSPCKPSVVSRASSRFGSRKPDLRRSANSSSDLPSVLSGSKLVNEIAVQRTSQEAQRTSLDEDSGNSLFGDDDPDREALSASIHSLDEEHEEPEINTGPEPQIVEAMEAALNNIMEDTTDPNTEDLRSSLFGSDVDAEPGQYGRRDSGQGLFEAPKDTGKPSIASLGLVNTSSRIGVFTDDDLFPDEEKFMSDEREDSEGEKDKDVDTEIHEAAPGDLGLAEAITALTCDIERLVAQLAVIDSLTRKAELTNNTAELRILRKSKASLEREIRRKELQRQQYVIQESDNSLYGRSTIKVKSIMVGKEENGQKYALYVIEVQRKAGEQMPAATWTVSKRYSEFHELHTNLRIRYPSVRNLEFPRRRMVMKLQTEFLHKRRLALEKYLTELLLLPDVCRSRDLRAFLSQSAIGPMSELDEALSRDDKKDMITRFYNSVTDGMEDILGSIPVLDQISVAGQNLLSAATSQINSIPTTIMSDDLLIAAEETQAELNAFENRGGGNGTCLLEETEPFVKPICDIFLEIFELNRGNNWLRGRAVVVVLHQLLGGTIERKIRENVKALVQEEAIVRYVLMVREALWPGGKKKEGVGARSPADKARSKRQAELMLGTLVPDLAAGVVGRLNAKMASGRLFRQFQNPRLK